MAGFNFILKDKKAEKETPIRLHINYNSKGIKIYFGEKIHPSAWDKKKQKATSKKTGYADLNVKLQNTKTIAENVFRSYQNENNQEYPAPARLKVLIETKLNRPNALPEKMDLFTFFDNYIELEKIRCENEGRRERDSVVKGYERSRDLLKEFAKTNRVDFDVMGREFYTKYLNFLLFKKIGDKKTKPGEFSKEPFKINTAGRHIKVLKTILNAAVEEGVCDNLKFRNSYFQVIREDAVTIYLDEQELELMANLKLSLTLERIRDSFLIGAWTGLRYSDFSRLSIDSVDFENEKIRIKTKKTGAPVVIPFLPWLKNIMIKYNDGVFPSYANQVMNRGLKEIGKALDKKISEEGYMIRQKDYSRITTHTARRSFCSNMYRRGIPTESIMSISGHKSEALFRKYIKISIEDRADSFKQDFEKYKPTVQLKIAN